MADEATEQDGTPAAPDGIDRKPVEAWFGEHVAGVDFPLQFERIAGGHSNLTYRVTDAAGQKWALRRPPLGKRLGSAHDMGREFKVVSALGGTAVPVAPVVGLCEDESVNGAPFYVMEFVEGPILRGLAEATGGRSASASPTPWSRSTLSTPTPPASATSAARRITSPASYAGGRGSGRSRRRASWSRSTASMRRSRPASPSRGRRRSSMATTASTT
jgi:hypothetical protein